MPMVLWAALGGAGLGFFTGFQAGGGTDAIARAMKWGAVGGGLYLAAKVAKVA